MSYKILYIEDETAIIELIDLVLRHDNIQLISALSGVSGLAKAHSLKPDLIILDVMIPEGDGWSIYNTLRSQADTCKLPIIMLTGQLHRYRIMKEFSKSPIDAYITKPFDVMAIRREIESMLGETFWPGSISGVTASGKHK
jgi:DNA-binding response OmpR family regulator